MTIKIARVLRSEFGRTILVSVKKRFASHLGDEVFRFIAHSEEGAYRLLNRVMFAHVRIRLFGIARFTFKKLPSIADPKPLRFFIPFVFCEPFNRWYKFAPFRVNIHSTESPVIHVDLLAEVQRNFKIDLLNNRMEKQSAWSGQAITSMKWIMLKRPTYSISFAWSK